MLSMVNRCGQLNYSVPMQAYTVGQFTITFAHSYTSNWQLGLLESSGEETILHEKICWVRSVCLHIKQIGN